MIIMENEQEIYWNLRKKYLLVYLLANVADWLQEPYHYKLYLSYGYVKSDISLLYITGFGASAISGIAVGYYADKFGRKKLCLLYFLSTIINCLCTTVNDLLILHIARIFGGISIAILFSTFESWYVSQHLSRYSLKKELIGSTLTDSTVYNGILAIFAGILSSIFVETLNFGLKAPFIIAIPLSVISGLLCVLFWDENVTARAYTNFFEALNIFYMKNNNDLLIYLGIIQTLFETVMYIFVFFWTPILEPIKLNNGVIFGGFMLCIVLGSACHSLLIFCRLSCEKSLFLSIVFALFSISLSTIGIHIQREHSSVIGTYLCLITFLMFELSVGMYFPAIGYLRGVMVPECHRASIANWFRLPCNIMICLVLGYVRLEVPDNRMIFALATGGLCLAVVYCIQFNRMSKRRDVFETKDLISIS